VTAPDQTDAPAPKEDDVRARRYAAALLGQRAYSRRTLIDRIIRKGFDPETARRVADRFVTVGVLDDEALAAALARAEIARKPAGPMLLEMKLVAKGIDRPTARRAAQAALADRDLLADAVHLARRRLAAMSPSVQEPARQRRLYAALARRCLRPGLVSVLRLTTFSRVHDFFPSPRRES